MEKDKYLDSLFDSQSKYCYESTDVLINKKNIKDQSTLEQVERIHTTYVLSKLYIKPVAGNFDINHYVQLHKTLFEDLYYFAGDFRCENISKGGIPFCRPEFIYQYLKSLLEQMKRKSLRLKSEEELINFLADFYSEINLVHPFREGNGRTQREFFREFILDLNKYINFGSFEIDYSRLNEVDKKTLILGCIESATKGTNDSLKEFFRACLVKRVEKTL